MADKKLFDMSVTFLHQTAKAYLVSPDGSKRDVWVSKQYSDIDPKEPKRGSNATLTIEMWFAEKIGLL